MRRLAGLAAILAGIAIFLTPFLFDLAGNANGGERITDRFRYTFTDKGLQQLQGGFATVVGMSDQFFTNTLPDLRGRLHESPAAFQADLRKNYPAITSVQKNVPPVVAIVKPQVPGLVALRGDFHKVDSLPFLGLPISSVPWLLYAIGLIVAGIGVFVFRRPSRGGAALVALAGFALIVVPLMVSAFDKAEAARAMDTAGAFVFNPKIVTAASATTHRIDRMVPEIKTRFIPRTAARLHESPGRLSAEIARDYPAVGRGLAAWPSIRPRALKQARDQVASVPDYANLHGLHYKRLPWTVIGPGILLLLVGGIAVATGGRTQPEAS
jgi:hypothetical protein